MLAYGEFRQNEESRRYGFLSMFMDSELVHAMGDV